MTLSFSDGSKVVIPHVMVPYGAPVMKEYTFAPRKVSWIRWTTNSLIWAPHAWGYMSYGEWELYTDGPSTPPPPAIPVVGFPVAIDGSASFDPDGDPITWLWSIPMAPVGSVAGLTATTTATTDFTPDLAGDYTVRLTVNDGYLDGGPADVLVTAVTPQAATTETMTQLQTTILNLPQNVVKNPNNRNALSNKIDVVLQMIAGGAYANALGKIESDLLPKTDGCALTGAPENNDWITDCSTQNIVYPILIDTATMLRTLL